MIVKVAAPDVPPPKPAAFGGVKTATLAAPTLAMSDAGICAVSCVAEINAVGRFVPFQRTTEVFKKLLPLTVSVNAGLPAAAVFGVMPVSCGAGGGGMMVNGRGDEVPPPAPAVFGGVNTVMVAVPPLTTSDAGICAVN